MAQAIAENAAKYGRIILQKKCRITDDCAICIDSLLAKPVMYLPCKHFFHQSCLKQAFEKKLYTCPLCRYDLIDALIKIDFKFPMVYNPYVGLSWTFTRETRDPYTRDPYDPYYDDMPELIDDDSDDLTLWSGLLFNMMQDHSMDNFENVPIMNVPIMNNVVNATDYATDYSTVPEPAYFAEPDAEPDANAISIDYVPSLYNVETTVHDIIIFYSFV